MPRPLEGERGLLSAAQVEAAVAPDVIYRAPTGVVTLENTAMSAGGIAAASEPQREVAEVCVETDGCVVAAVVVEVRRRLDIAAD